MGRAYPCVVQSSRLKHFNFSFIANLVLTRCIFDITLPVALQLQSKSLDIFNGISIIKALKNTLQCHLANIEEQHNKWYKIAKELASEVFIDEETPRLCGRQKHRANTAAKSPSEYYRRTVTQSLLEYILRQMTDRFTEKSMVPIWSFYYMVFLLYHLTYLMQNIFSLIKIERKFFANLYRSNFPNYLVSLVNVICGLVFGNFKTFSLTLSQTL